MFLYVSNSALSQFPFLRNTARRVIDFSRVLHARKGGIRKGGGGGEKKKTKKVMVSTRVYYSQQQPNVADGAKKGVGRKKVRDDCNSKKGFFGGEREKLWLGSFAKKFLPRRNAWPRMHILLIKRQKRRSLKCFFEEVVFLRKSPHYKNNKCVVNPV